MKYLFTLLTFSFVVHLVFAQSWTSLNCPTPGGQLGDINRNNNTIYATRLTGGFYKSTDAGVTWSNDTANYPTGQTQLFKCLKSGNILLHMFTGSSFPWYRSEDNGATWNLLAGSGPTNSSLFESSDGTLYSIPSFNGFSPIKTSVDEGTTWVAQTEVLKTMAFTSNGDAYGLRWRSGNADVKLAKSTDKGITWVDLSGTNLPYNVEQIAIANNGTIYVSGGTGTPTSNIYKSKDAGATFTNITALADEVFTDFNNNMFIKKSPSSFLVSSDEGATWNDAKTGLMNPSAMVRSIWAHPNGTTYASNYNNGTTYWGIYKYSSGSSSLNEAKIDNKINMYPNPSNGKFHLSIQSIPLTGDAIMEIYNSKGQMIQSLTLVSSESEIDLSNLGNGVYLLRISNGLERYKSKISVNQ